MMPDLWVQALSLPALSVTTPYTLRMNLARLLRTSEPAEAAIISGLRSDIPASAFLAGYQVAMRAVDSSLSPEQWACLCVSEKGLRSLSEMSTYIDNGVISGRKSHAMLAGSGMDWLYIIASDQSDLVCRRVKAGEQGVSVLPSDPAQPVVPELAHHALEFNEAHVDSHFHCADAHNEINKPFRYHEDVMTILAFSGWCLRMSDSAADQSKLVTAMQALAGGYRMSSKGYCLEQLNAFEALAEELMTVAAALPVAAADYWQRDRRLLVMGQKARSIIRQRLELSAH